MFTAASYDPLFYDRIRREQPRLRPNHIDLVRIAHHESLSELADLDAEFETIAARRRQVCRRIEAYRERLWRSGARRYHRRSSGPGNVPVPPAPADAHPLWGAELRRVSVAVLRRHGALPLRDLHGLLHRYGYRIDSRRPIQRLADALAFEVRHGRLQRVARGIYGVAGRADASPPVDPKVDLGSPLHWENPSQAADEAWDDPPPVDVPIADDPERWSDGRWPASAQLGSTMCAGPPDRDVADLAADLDITVAATRERFARLILDRLDPVPSPLAGKPYVSSDPHGDFDLEDPDASSGQGRQPDRPENPLGNDSSTNRSLRGENEPSDDEGEVSG